MVEPSCMCDTYNYIQPKIVSVCIHKEFRVHCANEAISLMHPLVVSLWGRWGIKAKRVSFGTDQLHVRPLAAAPFWQSKSIVP